jgi:hypothetical protein
MLAVAGLAVGLAVLAAATLHRLDASRAWTVRFQ